MNKTQAVAAMDGLRHPLLRESSAPEFVLRETRVEVTVDGDGDVTLVADVEVATGRSTILWKRVKEPTCAALRKALEELKAGTPDHAHRMAVADELIAVQGRRLTAMQKRLEHTDIELAQARESRDTWKSRYETLVAMLDAAGIETVSG